MAKKPLHIGILSTFFDPFMSGAEMCVDEIANRLGRRDAFAITIITARLSRKLPTYENRGRYCIVRIGLGYSFDKWLYPLLAPLKTKKINPDIVHGIMESYAGIALWLYGFLVHESRRILTLQSGDLDDKATSGKIPLWLWKRIHRSPDIVTSISHFLSDRAKHLGANRVELIPNGVSLGKLRTIAAEQKNAKEQNTIAVVARLSIEKGVIELIDAFNIVHKKHPTYVLHMIGDGKARQEVEKRIKQYALQKHVILHGTLPYEQAMARLAKSQLAVLPSRAEGLGIAGLEALALGMPLVATRVGGIPDFLTHEHNGLLVEAQNPEDIAHGLIRMIEDTQLFETCTKNAQPTVEKYEWKTIVLQHADMYREILQPRMCFATGIYPPDPGGPATYVKILEDHCAAHNMQSCTITYAQKAACINTKGTTLVTIDKNQSTFKRYTRYFLACIKYARRCDVIYVQDTLSAGLPARIAAMILGKPLVIKVVGDPAWERAQQSGITVDNLDDFQTKKYTPHIERIRALSRWVVRGAHKVITPSYYLKGVVQTWGINPDHIHVVYNSATFPEKSEPIQNWPKGNILLYVGRLVSWKGLSHLIDIMKPLTRQYADIQLVLIGEGPERPKLEKKIKEQGLEAQVTLLGLQSRSSVRWAMEHASVFTLFSTYEGLPHVLIEAQYAGLPIVASTAGGNGEVVTHKESGLLVDPDDNMALIRAIISILADKEKAQKLAYNGTQSALRFTKKQMLDATFTQFNEYARATFEF